VGPLALLLLIVGVAVAAFGLWRAWGAWQRWRALAAHEANLRRYESWRGGRTAPDAAGPSSADLMQAELRGQVVRWGGLAVVGLVLIVLALGAHPV
jgi:hypothetical protein